MRVIAIGDIHGCSTALNALLEEIASDAADTLVTLGDYVDRGPNTKGVLDGLLELQSFCYLVPLRGIIRINEGALPRAIACQ